MSKEQDSEPKPTSHSVGILLETQDRKKLVLVETFSGKWSPVAGRLKPIDNDYLGALERELREEAGLNLTQVRDLTIERTVIVEMPDRYRAGVVYGGVCDLPEDKIPYLVPEDYEEIQQVKVFSQDDIYDLVMNHPEDIHKPEFNLQNLIGWWLSKTLSEKADSYLTRNS